MLEKVVTAAPADLKAQNLLGIALMNTGRKEEAAGVFEKVLHTDPNFHAALKNLAVSEMALGRQQKAQNHFEQFLKFTPADPVSHLYLGEIGFAGQHYATALAHYRQSGGLQLRDPQATLHFAKSAVETSNISGAVEALNHLPADNAQWQFDAGVLLAAVKQYDAAARHFELAQNGFSDPYQAGFNLTLVYIEGQDFTRAIQAGERLAKSYRKAEIYNLLSRAYEASGRTQEAYDSLRTATEIDPRDEANYLDLMSLCVTHENWDLSLEISDIGLRWIPQSYRLRLQRGAVFAMKGRLEDAESEFLTAGSLAPEVSLPSVALALVKIDSNMPEQAVALLRARRAQNPKDYLVNWALGDALSRINLEPGSANEKEAAQVLEDAVRLDPAKAAPKVLLGKILARRGVLDQAARQFESALRLEPDNVTAAYQLALIYRKTGNANQAEALMTKVGKATSAPDPEQTTKRELVKIVRDGSK
jgi:tetratricopeptide (TPR) repeat protein